jgi:inner membrane protein
VPTIMTHAIAAAAIGALFARPRLGRRVWAAGAFCAMAPDLDVVGLAAGVPYRSPLGHRGLSHSILFAAALAWAVGRAVRGRGAAARDVWFGGRGAAARDVWFLFLATVSHPLLDALTDGGLGVALFAPFWNARLFAPVRPIAVSPIGTGFFSRAGLAVLASEVVWVWAPAAAVALAGNLLGRAPGRPGPEDRT